MRVADFGFDGNPVEAPVEISRCVLAAKLCQCGPKIDLVASGLTAKALVDVTPHVDGERLLWIMVSGVMWERTSSSPLVTTDREGFEVNSL